MFNTSTINLGELDMWAALLELLLAPGSYTFPHTPTLFFKISNDDFLESGLAW